MKNNKDDFKVNSIIECLLEIPIFILACFVGGLAFLFSIINYLLRK